MKFKQLFSKIQLKGLELKNRVIFPAMGTKMADTQGYVTQQLIDYHVARVKGGCGLNIVEVCSVHAPSAPAKFLNISDDKFIPGLRKMADAIREAGGKSSLQLWQGGLAVSGDSSAMVILPSDMPVSPEYTIPGASIEVIDEVVQAFGAAARRAVEAGFDCVEIHSAHNYMLHSFLSPALNHRQDEYGGSFENRCRFPLAVIREIRNNVPGEMPIFMRVDAHDDYLEGGLTIEDTIAYCKLAKEAGVDVLDVSRGNIITAAIKYEVPPVDIPQGFNVDNAAQIRAEVGLPTIAVGRINEPQLAEDILAADKADMVVIGRAQLADPEFCNKAMAGLEDEIVRCVGCNQGCFDGFCDPNQPYITCLRNPALGREREMELQKTTAPKKVLIAGGGMGGLHAAITLKHRGHHPILCEATDTLGGQFLLAGVAPRKEEMTAAAVWEGGEARRVGVEIRLNTPVTPALIEEIKPDAAIIAIGAESIIPAIPGVNLPHVSNSHDVLKGKVKPKGHVVVVGGGLVGLEVAELLAEKEHQKVTVVEMNREVAADLGQLRKICVMENIYMAGITPMVEAKCISIEEGKVVVEHGGKLQEIACDSVVIAIGVRSTPTKALEEQCEAMGIPCHVVGDALKARRALNAIAEADHAARAL
ncbi:NAD(P)/FAD-dependent oxidoreductase [Paenibacillus sp. N1-5-1-14]|uniref:bile acid Fe-S flavoenzyme BaiCD n=1 Tax=Paenibacillus radicibacter TaxID=2972488 RepID=UPI0021594395|nr:NAD(P)/FAD-dependent oxidoreductase [Paenibacillus radicibacter]MCR8645294.1 NAD(P)/FAD-dependent oxidoreductase [Paenibacillus radicibacter]